MAAEEEFINTVKSNEGIIYKIVRIYTFNRQDEQDLYQEIIYQLWKSFKSFKNYSKISTWIYKIALNTAIGHLVKEKRSGRKITFEDVILQTTEHEDREKKEKVESLYAEIKKLNPIDKGIMLLYLEGNNYEELATITGFTYSNIATRLSRIKQKLTLKFKI
jgi:RNA polymerase sigma factor (sigma-70 family)